ncbi:hypothetical protein [Cyanobacterium sp. Dongsha4]|uniref:tetratricopeptide repeat protein n=1 Tax=Cyanobacterium sp. DS4 TaxID=2878255 RepID=UPI002E8111E3|nr:hypothetical protein [Cyanobacterium sp. Dongsha4]WVL02231.1 hypothetical protein Dongsha4_08585 [Cyanobacterium sp. Dongsha4]
MNILVTIPHYYKSQPDSQYGSQRNPQSRIHALSEVILHLQQLFGLEQSIILIDEKKAISANNLLRSKIEIVICTTGNNHLLDQLDIPSSLFSHHRTNCDPLLLGFECHQVLADNLGKYDYYCYLEDDLVIVDPLFFNKLNWFNSHYDESKLLVPYRYELGLNQNIGKCYIDGDLSPSISDSFQRVNDEPELKQDFLDLSIVFERVLNPHSGCFFLNQKQMNLWIHQDYFLDRCTDFIGPLESSATLGIMKTFKVYKPAIECINFLELYHGDQGFIHQLGSTFEIDLENQWEQKIKRYLKKGHYQELIKFLESNEQIENSLYYCYLGLAYFLNTRKDEAFSAWFFVFQDSDFPTKNLVNILEVEAQRNLQNTNYQLSYEIREVIEEIDPYNVNNLLLMMDLAIELKIELINQEYLAKIIVAIRNSQLDDIDFNLIHRFLENILDFPFNLNIELVDTILESAEASFRENLIKLAIQKAYQLAHFTRYPLYAADLGSTCLKYCPKNLFVLQNTFFYLMLAYQFERAKTMAEQFQLNAITLEEKAYSSYLLIHWMLKSGAWLERESLVKNYQTSLSNLAKKNEGNIATYIHCALVYMTQYLLYFEDNPQYNRHIINGISRIYQSHFNHLQLELCKDKNYRKNSLVKKKIKIGYIAFTFRNHCVAYLCRHCISFIDRSKFDIYIYMLGTIQDEITEQYFKKDVTKFIAFPKDYQRTAQEIEKDHLDILVDLDCFTNDITHAVMALKPAPIQVSWLGLDSTGIPTIDYFMVDPYVVTQNAKNYYREKLWFFPQTYLAVNGFEIGISNLRRQDLDIPEDSIVYMSLQNGEKRLPENIKLQMKILQKVPSSYFLVSGGFNEIMQNNIIFLFEMIAEEEGVDSKRIKVLPFMPVNTYRGNIILGDVVLDTYPFNGATTTLDALWLNIPLVTRVGEQFHARQGYTFLTNLGIGEGIAWNDEEYIEWGVKFGTDEELRKKVYWKLRESKKTSPLWNGKQFAREMEKAYQQMWEINVSKQTKMES